MISSDSERILNISAVYTLSLADAGELTLYRQPTSITTLLQRVAAKYRLQAEQAAIRLNVAAAELPDLDLDEDRIMQVLSNLIGNTLHTPSSGTITLAAAQRGASIAVTVADTGRGIPPESLPHIFDRFYRADQARSQQSGESGLGLAIARAICEAHGGTISATSTLDHGATFTILLPLP